MIDQLRIQCPSCGIILDVRNSKNEAVKRITCPHCQKHLAVSFEEEEKPATLQPIEPLYYGEMRIDLQEGINHIPLPDCDFVEIKVVRLKDGNTKCIVHALNADHPVLVNSQPLGKDDEVVLAMGDQMQIGNTHLALGETASIEPLTPEPPILPKPIIPKRETKKIWLYASLTCIVLMGATIFLWPKESKDAITPSVVVNSNDSLSKVESQDENKVNPLKAIVAEEKKEEAKKKEPAIKSDFDLEKLASKGDAEAQYEIGRRKIKQNDSVSVVIGINYLKSAACNGSSKAKDYLKTVYDKLKKEATKGNSTAANILKENQ